jgi:hypothetical protein
MTATFNYPKEFVTLPEYTRRSGQTVDVLSPVHPETADEDREAYGECLMQVRFEDGFEGEAFESELSEHD